jgi:hypothetical protein
MNGLTRWGWVGRAAGGAGIGCRPNSRAALDAGGACGGMAAHREGGQINGL